jgi:hypothetical protein
VVVGKKSRVGNGAAREGKAGLFAALDTPLPAISKPSSFSKRAVARRKCYSLEKHLLMSQSRYSKHMNIGYKMPSSLTKFEVRLLFVSDNSKRNLPRHFSLQHPALQIPHTSHLTRPRHSS